MPREERQIIFTHAEVYEALMEFSRQLDGSALPEGRITAVRKSDAVAGELVVTLALAPSHEEHEYTYAEGYVAASLMLFCMSRGIPLPKAARKSILSDGDELILRANSH